MACHNKKGTSNNLLSAIYNSCNTFFAKTYKNIIDSKESPFEGINMWNSHLKSFGLGDYLGYDLNIGRPGFIPDGNYYNFWYPQKNWGSVTTISNSIGQGEILTTPIQMAKKKEHFTYTSKKRREYRSVDSSFYTFRGWRCHQFCRMLRRFHTKEIDNYNKFDSHKN